MPIETIISLVIALAALLFTAFSFRRTSYQDNTANATERANMSADIRYIRTAIDDIKVENKAIQRDMNTLQTKVVEIGQSVKSAHKRLDDLNRKGD